MPPFRNAKSLVSLCCQLINDIVFEISGFLYRKYGSYKHPSCYLRIRCLQNYLLSYLHPVLLDHCLEKVSLTSNVCESQQCILLSIYLHSSMRSLCPKFNLPADDSFLYLSISKLGKLVSLDLSMVCTDELLECVGHSCPLLEYISIISKVDTVRSNGRISFNALRLYFYISDDGLKHLLHCKKLKCIVVNKLFRSNCGGRKITHHGILNILLNLPNLENISYQDMGFVLSLLTEKRLFNLRCLRDMHASENHIELISSMCPKIKSLSLCLAYQDGFTPESCLRKLSESNLNLASISFHNFPLCSSMVDYLVVRGTNLSEVKLNHDCLCAVEVLTCIGQYCPKILVLELTLLVNEDDSYSFIKHNFYPKLKSLNLVCKAIRPDIIFQLCLLNATCVKTLRLINRGFNAITDGYIQQLLEYNPLCHLLDIHLEGFLISLPFLDKFINLCPSLKCLSLTPIEGLPDFIQDFISHSHFDVKINII